MDSSSICQVKRGNEIVTIETLWLVETENRLLLVRASSASEAAELLERDGYSAIAQISEYGIKLTQKGVVFSCSKVVDWTHELERGAE